MDPNSVEWDEVEVITNEDVINILLVGQDARPGYSDNRISASFAFGGSELLSSTLKTNFGIQVDGTISVNFEAFEKIIHILGGVDIELNAEEAKYMRNMGVSSSKDMNHFNGSAALDFARMRYASGGDYTRSERQRRLITSVIQSLKGVGLTEILGLVNDVLPYVRADLSEGGEMSSLRIPADDAHYAATINGMAILVPDLEMCQEDLKEFIYSAQ